MVSLTVLRRELPSVQTNSKIQMSSERRWGPQRGNQSALCPTNSENRQHPLCDVVPFAQTRLHLSNQSACQKSQSSQQGTRQLPRCLYLQMLHSQHLWRWRTLCQSAAPLRSLQGDKLVTNISLLAPVWCSELMASSKLMCATQVSWPGHCPASLSRRFGQLVEGWQLMAHLGLKWKQKAPRIPEDLWPHCHLFPLWRQRVVNISQDPYSPSFIVDRLSHPESDPHRSQC